MNKTRSLPFAFTAIKIATYLSAIVAILGLIGCSAFDFQSINFQASVYALGAGLFSFAFFSGFYYIVMAAFIYLEGIKMEMDKDNENTTLT